MHNKHQSKKSVRKKSNPIIFGAIAVAVIAIAVVFMKPGDKENISSNNVTSSDETTTDATALNTASSDTSIPATLNENGDIVIQIAGVSETATFYSYDSNGTTMGLLAVKASDGTIRTALDTCQVCNGSPYAFFVQQDDEFQCQNCGNMFKLDMIEQERGGCNPIPIMSDEKTVTDTQIIIPAQFFEDNAKIFENWKQF